jgi:protein O-mannosyl-transferase
MKGSWGFAAAALFVLAAVCAAYSNHFSNPFELDDMHTIVKNEAIRDLRHLGRFFTDTSTFSTLPANQAYRPGTTTLNAIDVWLGGTGQPEPRTFHVSIFAAYLVLGVFLFLFLLLLLRECFAGAWTRWTALFGAGFFLLHAANAETVNYVIARSDSFSTLMVLVAFVVYLGRPGCRRALVYLVPVAVGFSVKEPAVMFAPLLFVYLLLFRERLSLPELFGRKAVPAVGRALSASAPAFVLAIALFSLSRRMVPATFDPGGTDRVGYLLTQPFATFHYFNNFLLPVNLAVESDWTVFTNRFDDRVFAGLAFVVLMLLAAVRASRRPEGRPVAFGILWFFIALAPTSSLIPLAEVLNEHRPFFPYVGLTLAACGLVSILVAKHEVLFRGSLALRSAIAAAAVLLLGAHAFGVHRRNVVWASSESLWRDGVVKSPGSGRVLMNYALALMARGDYAHAREYLEKARVAWPNYSYIQINLGVLEDASGDPAKADQHFRNALSLDARNPEAYSYYAAFLRRQGREAEALDWVHRGLALSPGHLGLKAILDAPPPTAAVAPSAAATPESLLETSLVLYRLGKFEESAAAARRATELRPDWDLAWNNVCAALNRLDRLDEAIAAGEKAVLLNPGNELARNNLKWAREEKARRVVHSTH